MGKYDSYFKVGDVVIPKDDADLEFDPSWQEVKLMQAGLTIKDMDEAPCNDEDEQAVNLQTLFFKEIPYISAGYNYTLKP